MWLFVELAFGLTICTEILYLHDILLLKFQADPNPNRIVCVRVFGFLSWLATLGFYGTSIALFVMGAVELLFAVYGTSQDGPPILRAYVAGAVIGGLLIAQYARSRMTLFLTLSFTNTGIEKQGADIERAPNAGEFLPQFAAMQYYALILNRTYNVFVASTMLCGAKVAGLTASPAYESPEMLDERNWSDTLEASLYRNIDVTSPEFLRLNFANFQIPWSQISKVDYNPSKKWGMGNVPHSGRILLRLTSGGSRELILLGRQDGYGLVEILRNAMPSTA